MSSVVVVEEALPVQVQAQIQVQVEELPAVLDLVVVPPPVLLVP